MLTHRQILTDYMPLVKGFVLDCQCAQGLRPIVRLNVIVDPETSGFLCEQITTRLMKAFDRAGLMDIARDFDCYDGFGPEPVLNVSVRHLMRGTL